jgi:hypothetical protein
MNFMIWKLKFKCYLDDVHIPLVFYNNCYVEEWGNSIHLEVKGNHSAIWTVDSNFEIQLLNSFRLDTIICNYSWSEICIVYNVYISVWLIFYHSLAFIHKHDNPKYVDYLKDVAYLTSNNVQYKQFSLNYYYDDHWNFCLWLRKSHFMSLEIRTYKKLHYY